MLPVTEPTSQVFPLSALQQVRILVGVVNIDVVNGQTAEGVRSAVANKVPLDDYVFADGFRDHSDADGRKVDVENDVLETM